MQTWPALRYLPAAAISADFSGSASAKTMTCSEIRAGTPNTRLSTPLGRPASWKARTSSTQVPGVSSESLMMIEQPAPSAPPILRAGDAAGDDAAIGALPLLGIPLDDVGGDGDLDLGLGERLALLERKDAGDGVGALTEEVGGLAHDARALVGRRRAPDLEALLRRGEGAVEIGRARMRQRGQRLLGRRIDHRLAVAAAARKPLAIDVQSQIRIHLRLLPIASAKRRPHQ